jgi:hypothetical protein
MLIPFWFLLAYICVKVMQVEKTKDPFYIITHTANNVKSLKGAVSQGVNAIQNDFSLMTMDNQLLWNMEIHVTVSLVLQRIIFVVKDLSESQ